MRKQFVFLFVACLASSLHASAQTVGRITAHTTRMSPQVLTRHFLLKPGEPFSVARYQQAQQELHRLRVFKTLDFDTHTHNGQTDIDIYAKDGWYLFPMGFYSGGSKSAGGLSLAGGNLFKQGESTFLFTGGSRDGWMTQVGWAIPQHFLSLRYNHLNAEQRFYQGHWVNNPGIFSTVDDEEDYKDKQVGKIKKTQEQILFTYKYRLSRTAYFSIRPQYNYITYGRGELDSGKHHQITAGMELKADIRPGMNMGALSGYGLTDKKQSLQDLPRARSGYTGGIFYTAGGSWSGSDYTIAKLTAEGTWIIELPQRHVWWVQLQAGNAFKAPFSDEVASTDLMSGMGRYARQIRGQRGAGISSAFVYYLLRNQTGLLSVAPFYELAYVDTGHAYTPHSGAGASLTYRFWRFPLPIGINYTHNLQDGSHQVGLMVGGAFG